MIRIANYRNMKSLTSRFVLFLFFLSTILFSCVPARQVEEMKTNYKKCQEERDAINAEKNAVETELTELKSTYEDMRKQHNGLLTDTTVMGNSLRVIKNQYDKINRLNDELMAKMKELQSGAEVENKVLMAELQTTKEELLKKEDALKTLEMELFKKQTNLERLSKELEEREKRVKELEDLIAKKDAKMKELRDRIAKALRAFEGKGLTITEKDGRIYVSMEAQLLFAKGSTAVDPKGKKILVDLAKVLEDLTDIHVLVEGHTDTDKMAGTTIPRDNWELSVLRATAVVKIMTGGSKIDPKRLTAAGRSQYVPVDLNSGEEAMSKNRRIEIILTPNLDELYELLEN